MACIPTASGSCRNKSTYLGCFLLELFDGSLVDTSALVDEVTSSRRLARIYVANDDDVNVSLLLRHGDLLWMIGCYCREIDTE